MRPVYALRDAKTLDSFLISKYSLSSSRLIDKAGALSAAIVEKENENASILVLLGPGNNGADGLALSEILSHSHIVSLYFYSDKSNDEVKERKAKLNKAIKVIDTLDKIRSYDVVIDALFGFSFHGEIDSYVINALKSAKKVYALDVPSGFAYNAYKTITFTTPKKEFYFDYRAQTGLIDIANPGFPEEELIASPENIYLLEDSDLKARPMSLTSYKNSRGHVAFIGGSSFYPGAALLASKALIKGGSGLVTIYSDESTKSFVINNENSIINGRDQDLSRYDALLVGAGWGNGDEVLFKKAIDSALPIVIDADGLKQLNRSIKLSNAIITPHMGEFKRLLNSYEIKTATLEEDIKELSRKSGAVVVLKTSVVYITDGDVIYLYDGENPALGVGGSGDILGGIIASSFGRGASPLDAAINGVTIHQKAGRELRDRVGFFTATELLEEVGRVCFKSIFSL